MLEQYKAHQEERAKINIPPLPLNAEQTEAVCKELETTNDIIYKDLLVNRVSPGVDPSAKVKASWLAEIANGEKISSLIEKKEAIEILGTMLGGYNIESLINGLKGDDKDSAANALKNTIMVYDKFSAVKDLCDAGNEAAKSVMESWSKAEWFFTKDEIPAEITGVIYKVDGETNTDDLSPALHASTRPDIPLHANAMYESRDTKFLDFLKDTDKQIIMAGSVYGTGSSRKSATNSLLWAIGDEIPFVPNKKNKGVLLANIIAPIFLNTMRDAGSLPIQLDVASLNTGDEVVIKVGNGTDGVVTVNGKEIKFELPSISMLDEYRAGGRIPLIIGKDLTEKARNYLGLGESDYFIAAEEIKESSKGFTLAQKMVGRACGKEGVRANESCSPKMTTVGSQDTTGPMTSDEMKELSCLSFKAPLVMQSFCHTAAYPKKVDVAMHSWLPEFISERKGVALKPGDGVIHSWLNKMLLPDTVGTGGDSHTRFPIGISFPSGSGLVAFAAAMGFMPLDMPESILIKFTGELKKGISYRDAVNMIPYLATQRGELTTTGEKKNIFAGKIIEIEGLEDLSTEEAFEFSDASAERSAAACVVNLSDKSVINHLKENVEVLKTMVAEDYSCKETLESRIKEIEEWLKAPNLLRADEDAEYSAVYEINLSEINEPILCCPNDPDKVALLSEVANTKVDEVFVGSCMTNMSHFHTLTRILESVKEEYVTATTWISPPTKMDEKELRESGVLSLYGKMGIRKEIPGCSLCMGNQARVRPSATVFSTSTRNFNNRMGKDAQVYLGSAELAAIIALIGKIPTVEEYMKMV